MTIQLEQQRVKKSGHHKHHTRVAEQTPTLKARVLYHLPQLVIVLIALRLWLRPVVHLLNQYWWSHTGWSDPIRALGVVEAWNAGMWDARWMAGWDWGYGYPFLSYYAPLFHWFSGLFTVLFESASRGLRVNLAMWMFIGTIGVYAASSRFWSMVTNGNSRAWFPGLFTAIAWLMSPYLLVNAYVRGAQPELASGQMLAWQMFGCLGFMVRRGAWSSRDSGDALIFFFATACGMLLHNFLGMVNLGFACVMLLFCAAIRFLKHGPLGNWRESALRFGAWLAGAGSAAMASMFFWLPALKEGKFVRTDTVIGGFYHYTNHFVEVANLLVLNYWDYGASVPGFPDMMPLHLGYISILGLGCAIAGFFIAASIKSPARRVYFGGVVLLIVATVTGLLLTMKPSELLWEHVRLLQFGQFPWRLLTIPTLGIVLLIPAPLVMLPATKRVRIAGIATMSVYLALMFALSNANYARIHLVIPWLEEYEVRNWNTWQVLTAEIDEYGPIWRETKREASLPPGEIVPSPEVQVTNVANHHNIRLEMDVTNGGNEAGDIIVALNYFPPWKAKLTASGQSLKITPTDGDGFIRIEGIPPGESRVKLWFGNTPLRARTKFVSAVMWLLAFAAAFYVAARRILEMRRGTAYSS